MTTYMEAHAPFIDQLRRLRTQHLGANKRRDQTALDVLASAWLCEAIAREQARRVLELGSGFSSWALRSWQQTNGKVEIWTVDDEARWLETTRIELNALHLRTDHVLRFDELLAQHRDAQFDVVFVDLDSTDTRARYAEQIVHWTTPGGLIVLDDWHMEHYRTRMTNALSAFKITPLSVPETTDQFGRYLAFGRKPT